MQSNNIIIPNNHNKRTTTHYTPSKNNNNNNNNNNTSIHTIPHHRSHASTTQACAACKYQRRKCASDCILAPYFPHDRQRQFLNAHRLFGVSNIVKIIRPLDPPAKDHAMRTIIFQSEARAADPVGGCYRIIRDLEQQISLVKAELEIVLHQLTLCRAAAARQVASTPPSSISGELAGSCNKEAKWRGDCGENEDDEVVVIDDVNLWNCMHENTNGYAESTSSSFAAHDHHRRSLSFDECNHDMKAILDQLSGDDHDGTHEEFKFDSHGNILVPRFLNLQIMSE
ncbi:UNVERIFIED_CONTAM: LOB domain-containing protein 22 [Sesamum radiatum]|uniref:LOB domain-containing protein 22 n=1 Tax=Sesamum radiatum TaxID=300843 RepID=A0AAW2VPA4_SESRA